MEQMQELEKLTPAEKIKLAWQLYDEAIEKTEMPKAGTADWLKAYMESHPENQCVIYKTRGEDCPAKTHKDIEEYQRHSRDCWGEYAYLFKNGEWFVLEYDDAELKSVERVLEKDEEDSE